MGEDGSRYLVLGELGESIIAMRELLLNVPSYLQSLKDGEA